MINWKTKAKMALTPFVDQSFSINTAGSESYTYFCVILDGKFISGNIMMIRGHRKVTLSILGSNM